MTDEGSNSTGQGGGLPALQRFKVKFSILTWILFIIFIGIVYTKIVMILSMNYPVTMWRPGGCWGSGCCGCF